MDRKNTHVEEMLILRYQFRKWFWFIFWIDFNVCVRSVNYYLSHWFIYNLRDKRLLQRFGNDHYDNVLDIVVNWRLCYCRLSDIHIISKNVYGLLCEGKLSSDTNTTNIISSKHQIISTAYDFIKKRIMKSIYHTIRIRLRSVENRLASPPRLSWVTTI